jgi:ABC-type transport system involved in cytochrome c biogenesis permease subunit
MKPGAIRSVLAVITSLRLTIVLLVLSILIIFAATLDQVNLGVWGVQEKYFRSFFVFGRVPGTSISFPVFPGGYLLGGILIVNLVAAHVWRFKLSWKKSGIWLAHTGLILLLAGEGVSLLMQKDSQMRIDVGQTRRYAESFREYELAVTDASNPAYDEVVSIPATLLTEDAPIQHPRLPFVVKPVAYFQNAILQWRNQIPNPPPSMATLGLGTQAVAIPEPVTAKEGESNWPAAYVQIQGPEGSLGTFLLSAALDQPESFAYQNRAFRVALRPKRDYLPFSLTLAKFTHDVYPGTDIPKNFASLIRLKSDDGRDDRDVRIFMNNPLRYAGRAFYQAGYDNNDRTTVLEVVRNPGWTIPYVSCALVALGLAVQFGIHLFGFFGRRLASLHSAAGGGSGPGNGGAVLPAPGGGARGRLVRASGTMERHLPIGVLLIAFVSVAMTLVPRGNPGDFDLNGFGRLPVLADGRMKPFDTIARTGLLVLQGRQLIALPDNRTIPPDEWLLDVLFKPELADQVPVFRIDNSEVLSLFDLGTADTAGQVRFSFAQLRAGLDKLDRQAELAGPVDASARTAFQSAVVELREHVEYYSRLKYSLQPPDSADFYAELSDPAKLKAGRAGYEAMQTFSPLRAIPVDAGSWESVGQVLTAQGPGAVDPHVLAYAELGRAWRASQPAEFNEIVRGYRTEIASRFGDIARRCSVEAYFNQADLFFTSLLLYVAAFLLALFSWLKWPQALGSAAFRLMGLAFVLATAGILARMWLEGRPPVTNLYSSALFIGWGATGLCIVLERIHRNGMASSAGSLIGFGTLVIALHLSKDGDTMEMMRAVLDSNFWLSTHVLTVTIGYASTFLAGMLAILYIVRGALTRTLDSRTADSLARMVYGIVCFATFFSFVGTVLGGIWADQSWGRFWGWDPKENGALIIVLWNAVILHCRWAGLVRQRGLMSLAVFGNVVTAWSWFGTNMLGVGLHSYGFTNSAFYGLISFVLTQLALIGLSALPVDRWRSFEAPAAARA